jgi:predicted TIM-barrel fold metal-dependent hydrolase
MRDGIFVADAHAHVFPHDVVLYGRSGRFGARDLLFSMDANGIDFSVVVARPTLAPSLHELSALHDSVLEEISPYSARLCAFAWASPRLGDAGLRELERCLENSLVAGIELHAGLEAFNIDDEFVSPVAEVAAHFDVPVSVHTQLAVRGAEPWRLLRLARRHPSVNFLMGHLGGDGSMLQTGAAAEIAARAGNISVEVSGTVTDPWATYRGPSELLGPDRVIFASDSPLHQPALNLLKLDLLEMERPWREAILGRNLLRLLRRDLPG